MSSIKYTKIYSRVMILLISVLILGGCITEEDSCKSIVATVGEPDMTASPVFAATTVAQNTTIDVNIAVDEETIEGTVYLLPVGSQDIADTVSTMLFTTVDAGLAETVAVTLTIATPPTGDYYPVVVLCDSVFTTCTTGAGYFEDISGLLAEGGNYVRGTANGGTTDLSSLGDSCVDVVTVEVL